MTPGAVSVVYTTFSTRLFESLVLTQLTLLISIFFKKRVMETLCTYPKVQSFPALFRGFSISTPNL